MNEQDLRIISFLDNSHLNNIYNEFSKYDQIMLYSCFADTYNKNTSFVMNNTTIEINRINDIRGFNKNPVPLEIMQIIYSKYLPSLLRIVNRYSDMLGVFKSYQSIEKKSLELIEYCYNFIISKKPNVVFYYDVPHLPIEYCFYILAKEMQIELRILFPMQLSISENESALPAKIVKDISSNPFAFQLESNLNYKNTSSSTMSFKTNITDPKGDSSPTDKYFNKSASVVKLIFNSSEYNYILRSIVFSLIHRLRSVLYFFLNKSLFLGYKKFPKLKKLQDLSSTNYYYFPLHLQPEASTMARSLLYEDQLYLVKLISKALPDGVKLVLKEHPAYFLRNNLEDISYYRNARFYRSLNSMDNVLMVTHSTSSQKLVDHCSGVISISGSVLMESFLSNKPAMVFGETNYMHLKNVSTVNNEDDIKEFLQLNLSQAKTITSDNDVNSNLASLLSGFEYVEFYNINSKHIIKKNNINSQITKLFLESMRNNFNDT